MVSSHRTFYTVAIDLNTYAGNYERAMAWYILNQEPEYMHGGLDWLKKAAEDELAEGDSAIRHSLVRKMVTVNSEHGDVFCYIVESPGNKEYNSVGIFFDEPPTPVELNLIMRRAKEFTKITAPEDDTRYYIERNFHHVKILGIRVTKTETITTPVETVMNREEDR